MNNRMPFGFAQLHTLARDFAVHAFAVFPEWKRHASLWLNPYTPAEDFRDDPGHDLAIHVPPPDGVVDGQALSVEIDRSEVTVYYAGFHMHFPWFPLDDESASAGVSLRDEPFVLIRDILNEDVAVRTHFTDEKQCGSDIIPRQSVPPVRRRWYKSPHRERIRSWQGTFNRDY